MNGLPPGKVIAGRYRIEQLLGTGGLGAVYLAEHTALGSRVALKCIPLAQTESERVLREARAGAMIQHPNVVRVLDIGVEDDVAYIVMEYLQGHNLEVHMRHGASQKELIRLLLGAIEGAAAAHDLGYVHRDLKPSNLFVAVDSGGDARCIITDFGLAKLYAEDAKSTTGEHSVIGTPTFMAPEQVTSSRTVGPEADVYSLGVILYEIVTGRLPFEAESIVGLMMAKLNTDPAAIGDACSPSLAALIMLCLQRDPRKRPKTTELINRLKIEFEHLGNQATPGRRVRRGEITIAINATIPPGFTVDASDSTKTSISIPTFQSAVFGSEEARSRALQSHLEFYTQHVDREYSQMRIQVDGMHRLWLLTIAVTIAMTISSVLMVALARLDVAAAVAIAGLIPGWFVRVFHKREDYFRSLQEQKSSHLRYGRQWLMALQTADSLGDPVARSKALQRICEALLPLLGSERGLPPGRSTREPQVAPQSAQRARRKRRHTDSKT